MSCMLADDVWSIIYDCVQTLPLTHVCRSLWTLLRARYLALNMQMDDSWSKVVYLQENAQAVRTLFVKCQRSGLADLVVVGTLPALTALEVEAETSAVGDNPAALRCFQAFPQLRTLTLRFWYSRLGVQSVRCMAGALQTLGQLRELRLDLACNDVKDEGSACLARLRFLPRLETLELGLDSNNLGDDAATALSKLWESPSLTDLCLLLRDNDIGDEGAIALADSLTTAPVLLTLELHLNSNRVSNDGALALAALKAHPTLAKLTLSLFENYVGEEGAAALVAATERGPRCYTLDLSYNVIRTPGRQALLALDTPKDWRIVY